VASPLGFLRRAGFAPDTLDIAADIFDDARAARAQFVAVSVPMHTALRLGLRVMARVREINPDAVICCYGLYAALNADYLLEHGADFCIGGECEGPLVRLLENLETGPVTELEGAIQRGVPERPFLHRLPFAVPSPKGPPPLAPYASPCHG